MTGFTRQPVVLPLQYEFCVLIVPEQDIDPLAGVVTFLTCLSVFAFMLIIQLVTGDAG